MQYKKEDFTVGQVLWYVNTQRHQQSKGKEVTIAKVGHKFLTIFTYLGFTERVYIENLQVDGGQYISPAQCYLSEQDYIVQKAITEANAQFKYKLHSKVWQKEFSLSVIAQVEKLLEL